MYSPRAAPLGGMFTRNECGNASARWHSRTSQSRPNAAQSRVQSGACLGKEGLAAAVTPEARFSPSSLVTPLSTHFFHDTSHLHAAESDQAYFSFEETAWKLSHVPVVSEQ
jgi:hypothetical protein